MKSNTYDISTYKFYAVKSDCSYASFGLHANEEAINREEYQLIPYEELDGLTFDDLSDIGFTSSVFIACFCDFPSINTKKYRAPIFYVDGSEKERSIYEARTNYRALMDRPIDEVVTEALEERYKSASDYEKRIYNCFFERYRDLSHQDTEARIKRLEKIK